MESGRARVQNLIQSWADADSSFHKTPYTFARIVVDLFPDWFDFEQDKFALLRWERGLHLLVAGPMGDFVKITTSDSRCMACEYFGDKNGSARMDMHYKPGPEELEQARLVIRLALAKLFPTHETIPPELSQRILPGYAFPPNWDGRIFENKTAVISAPSVQKPWWKLW